MTGQAEKPAEKLERSTPALVEEVYRTGAGSMIHGMIEDALSSDFLEQHVGKVNLIFTSPPFPLVHKKKYGNETGDKYLSWLCGLAPRLAALLADDGSLVIEIGNAWLPGDPVMSRVHASMIYEPESEDYGRLGEAFS